MRVQLDTIAVWDAIKSGGECFLCSLKKQAETRSVKFYLGPSVMNPETRVKVNQSWFCHDHVQQLLAADSEIFTLPICGTPLSCSVHALLQLCQLICSTLDKYLFINLQF